MTTLRDVALLRIAAQRIAGPPFPTAAAAVRWLTAVQAQDYPGGIHGVGPRRGMEEPAGPGLAAGCRGGRAHGPAGSGDHLVLAAVRREDLRSVR
ncbi:hypothetical protein [Georgenia sp. AZ-5]|uniref:hypothetical protein n=1 Tax=Georgenia sp. AZ-5 TaxID=3367526 RepID=UPI00375400ED